MTETFVLIKPDAHERRLVGRIITRIEEKGFKIMRMRLVEMGRAQAGELYVKFADEPFFDDLLTFMTSGSSIAMVLKHPHCQPSGLGPDVIAMMRELVGPKANRSPGTIRGDLAETYRRNVIHASDSLESARREIHIFFPSYL